LTAFGWLVYLSCTSQLFSKVSVLSQVHHWPPGRCSALDWNLQNCRISSQVHSESRTSLPRGIYLEI